MPGWSGAVGSNLYKAYGLLRSGDSHSTVLTGVGAVNSKSPYTPICSSLEFNASGIMVVITPQVVGAVQAATLTDIAVGAAGSEVDIISNLLYCASGNRIESVSNYIFDRIQIPAGSRLSARYQINGSASSATGTTTAIALIPFVDDISDVLALGRCITYGVDLANTTGAQVDPGGTANTLGAWFPIVTSTLAPIRSMLLGISSRFNQALTSAFYIVDIGIGGAGSEQVIFSFQMVEGTTSDAIIPNVIGPLHFNIPAGSRISARAQCTINDATDRVFDIVLYGMD